MEKIKVVQYGFGPIGIEIVETLLTRPWAELVGVVDVDTSKVGKDVGQFLRPRRQTGITVSNRPDDVLKADKTSPRYSRYFILHENDLPTT